MSLTIAVSGKGGTGKTTLAGLIIKSLVNRGKKPVLAVDADANATLNEVLGLEVAATVGSVRENVLAGIKDLPASMSKSEILDMKIQSSLIEAAGYDLLVMGRPEGPGCYCFANNLIRDIIEKLTDSYPFIVIDNEAGMEHLSRRTTQKIDILFIIANPIKRSVLTAKRISDLVDEMDIAVRKKKLIINRADGELTPELIDYIESVNFDIAAAIPEDRLVYQMDSKGQPTYDIDQQSAAYQAIDRLIGDLVQAAS